MPNTEVKPQMKSTKNRVAQDAQQLAEDVAAEAASLEGTMIDTSTGDNLPDYPFSGMLDGAAASVEEKRSIDRQRAQANVDRKRQQAFQTQYTQEAEREFTRTKYEPLRMVMHKGRQEWCIILRQHTLTDFSYIAISDFDNTDRKYLQRYMREAKQRRYQCHEVMRDRTMMNGNNALEYFLHFATHIGYGSGNVNALAGREAPKMFG